MSYDEDTAISDARDALKSFLESNSSTLESAGVSFNNSDVDSYTSEQLLSSYNSILENPDIVLEIPSAIGDLTSEYNDLSTYVSDTQAENEQTDASSDTSSADVTGGLGVDSGGGFGLLFDSISDFFTDIGSGGGDDEEAGAFDTGAQQRTAVQCVLLSAMGILEPLYESALALNENVEHYPHNGKIIRIRTENPGGITSILSGCTYFKYLRFFTPKHLSLLVPQIRLYKVLYEDFNEPPIAEIPISFEQNDTPGIDFHTGRLYSAVHRGFGVGIKNVDWSYEGTNPATARRDVKLNLSLIANSFEDMMKERQGFDISGATEEAYTYRLIDLMLHSSNDSMATKVVCSDSYQYKIKVEIGWTTPDAEIRKLFLDLAGPDGTTISEDELDSLFGCLKETLFLVLLDHTMNVENEGQILVNLEYRAFIEENLKGQLYNILYPTKDLNTIFSEIFDKSQEVFSQCSAISDEELDSSDDIVEEVSSVGEVYETFIQKMKYKGFQHIFKELQKRERLYKLNVRRTDIVAVSETGVNTQYQLAQLAFDTGAVAPSSLDSIEGDISTEIPSDEESLLDWSEQAMDAFESEGEDVLVPITYFFLGDLLDIVYDYAYTKTGKRMRLVLTDFPYLDGLGGGSTKYINMAHIPIAVDYFMEWYASFAIATDQESYSLIDFVRTMATKFITNLAGRECGTAIPGYNNYIQTGFMQGGSVDGQEPFDSLNSGLYSFNLSMFEQSGFLNVSTNTPASDVWEYYVLYPFNAMYLREEEDLDARLEKDMLNGIVNFSIASKTGFVKNMTFSKNDVPFLREARFERYQIASDLSQLGNVYDVNIELFGIPNFYPGQRIFIDPYALGVGFPWNAPATIEETNNAGTESTSCISDDPAGGGDPAWHLGIGGYHVIVSVNSSISRGEYTTTLACRWESSDGLKRLFDAETGAVPVEDAAFSATDCGAKLANLSTLISAKSTAIDSL